MALVCAVAFCGCSAANDQPAPGPLGSDAGAAPPEEPADPRQWSHERLMQGARLLSPEASNGVRVLILAGSHYQMGYQHGVLMKREIGDFWDGIEADAIWRAALGLFRNNGPQADGEPGETYIELARRNAYDFIKAECEGLADGVEQRVPAADCVGLSSLLGILEDLIPRHAPFAAGALACSQFVARGPATVDGKLIHGRNMDWIAIDSILNNPLIIVRQPDEGLKHISVAWPGMISTLTGINEAGLSVAVDENGCTEAHRDLDGRPPMQQLTNILQRASTVEQARTLIEQTDHAACQIFIVTHGPSRSAALFEITASGVGVRSIDVEDVLYAANHFAFTEVMNYQPMKLIENLDSSSVTRHARLRERLTGESFAPHLDLAEDAPDYAFGRIDVEMAIDLMRDPLDLRPESDRKSFPCSEFKDGNWAVGNNHNMHSVIFVPEEMQMWVASGWDAECTNPIYSPYVGFDLEELFGGRVRPGRVPTYDPPYNSSYGTGVHE